MATQKQNKNTKDYYKQSPTKKQADLVDEIAKTLKIDFPQSSLDYTRGCYGNFIRIYKPFYDKELSFIEEEKRTGKTIKYS